MPVTAGHNLRALRVKLGLTMRDVENASLKIALRHQNDAFAIAISRLSDFETKMVTPNIYRLYSMAVIYRQDLRELLHWYDVDLNAVAADMEVVLPPKSHVSQTAGNVSAFHMPVRFDPGFDARQTMNLGRMVEDWGLVPLAHLAQFASSQYTYGYIGSEDLTMYPVLPPGSFIQVDESKNKVEEGKWQAEYERPIYFVETREGYVACWCALKNQEIILMPHPLSPVSPRTLRYFLDAEVIGQVIGAGIRLGRRQRDVGLWKLRSA